MCACMHECACVCVMCGHFQVNWHLVKNCCASQMAILHLMCIYVPIGLSVMCVYTCVRSMSCNSCFPCRIVSPRDATTVVYNVTLY